MPAAIHSPPATFAPGGGALSNAEIAHRLTTLAQLLTASGENPFKIKAYRRAADTIQVLPESIAERVMTGADLTGYPGIGTGIASAIQEIVTSGNLRRIDALRAQVPAEIAALTEFPRLDPKRVQQIYHKFGISSVTALREKLESGDIGRVFGPRIEHHVRGALLASPEFLLSDVDELAPAAREFLRAIPGVRRVEPAGDFRRRQPVIRELVFVMEADDFAPVVAAMQRYGGRSELVGTVNQRSTFRLPNGLLMTIECASRRHWGATLLLATGSEAHLEALETNGHRVAALARRRAGTATERAAYRALGLPYIPPELREGLGEVALAASGGIPRLVTLADVRGDLHMHTTASDGAHTVEEMAIAARERGYEYIGIADHSQSLRIAGGLSEDSLRRHIRQIDRLNSKLRGIRVLKSAEVDIRVDGTLDYPDDLLAQLDYTVCSIHSRFGLGKHEQTERILRAMDHPAFSILGHATGRLLLRRPGYQLEIERVIEHAKARGCFVEINASPDRLDLSDEHARLAREAGVKIAINTDAHSFHEFEFMRCGLDVARRAGCTRADILNCLPWTRLQRLLRR